MGRTGWLLGSLALVACAAPPAPELPAVLPGAGLGAASLAFPPAPDDAAAAGETWFAECGPRTWFPMGGLLSSIATGMVHQRIPYGRAEEWRDCSGDFLRLSSYVAAACPPGQPYLAAPPGIADYDPDASNVPDLEPRARSSRDLARWFNDTGRFVPVFYPPDEEPEETLDRYRYLLKGGAVLWFAHHPPQERHGIEQLFSRNARGTGIHHIGTVVATELDDDGQVVGYSMFHGGNAGRIAAVTDEHRFASTGGRPPFGNGDDWLVGIGTLLPIVEPPARP